MKIRSIKISDYEKKRIKRINLWVDDELYTQIKRKADEAFLRIATYTRQLIQQAMKNKSINI
jgi:predicted DNA binding CopG/RHH family protein